MKLSDAIYEFDLYMSGGARAEATRIIYAYSTKKLREFLGDDISIEQISISQLRRWRAEVKKTGLSIYTFHRDVRQIRRFFRWCVEESYLEASPAERLELPKLPRGEPPKAISDVDLDRILNTAQTSSPRDYAIVRFLAESGCRVGGLVGLRFDNLDLDRGYAYVTEKGEITRTVSFGDNTIDALQDWLVVRPQKWEDIVFVGKRGPLTPSGVYRVLERLAKQGDVKGRFNPHSFRHALARRLLQNGADMGTVSQILGHSDIDVTHRFYGRWTENELTERHRRFGGNLEKLPQVT